MSASVADILRGAGFVPVVPELPRKVGTPENNAVSYAPVVPVVPDEKSRVGVETASQSAMKCDDTPDAIRNRLLALTAAEYRDPALVHALSEPFLHGLHGMDDDSLRALLSMLADDADRRALKRPKDDTAAILCRKCGPVWVHPSIAAALPVVDGWPRALGCPWCFIHPHDGADIPRPTVA